MKDGEKENSKVAAIGELFKDEYAVILVQGKNGFGDVIYSYVEVAMPNIKHLYAAINSGKDFTPSDFGTIVAAGKGIPPEGLRNEMSSNYNMLRSSSASVAFKPQGGSVEKRAWDEY